MAVRQRFAIPMAKGIIFSPFYGFIAEKRRLSLKLTCSTLMTLVDQEIHFNDIRLSKCYFTE